ncbi:MAG: GtrA family protein [Paucimonas sp.]|jgi:putative flippase GtrA|nr:GtrA family protein [Paucimonas sp.]
MVFQLARFGTVGLIAACVHWSVVAALVPLGLLPLQANVVAFITAFNVSYWGHRRWTFNADRPHRSALPRFLLTACSSFVLNQTLYYFFLTYTSLDYRVSLLIVLVCVAILTFFLSRQWAFR